MSSEVEGHEIHAIGVLGDVPEVEDCILCDTNAEVQCFGHLG